MTKDVITAPLIGHGNPFAAEAIRRLGQAEGIETKLVFQETIPRVANTVHQFRTSVPALAERYTKDSSAREGVLAKAFGKLSFIELTHRLGLVQPGSTLHLTQEHVLLGTSEAELQKRGLDSVRLLVPDVYPKTSGKVALLKHIGATAMVWNRSCYEELLADGIEAQLVKPFYLDAFRPNSEQFQSSGKEVVAKISGSGMPRKWRKQLSEVMADVRGIDWSLHYPEMVEANYGNHHVINLSDSIESFFNDLGGNTRVLVGFPSELVNIAFDLRSRDVPVKMITLPPRGEHEYRNLLTAIEYGIAMAELRFDDRPATIDGLAVVRCANLPSALAEGDEDIQAVDLFLGDTPYWSSLACIRD